MALSTLDSELGIIAALPDEPNDDGGLTAAQLKAKFDEAAKTIQTYLNDTHLPEHTAANTASEAFTGIASENVQDALEELYNEIQGVILGDITDDTITLAKLKSDVPAKIAKISGWGLLQSYTSAGIYSYTVPDTYGDGLPYEIGIYEIGGGGSGGTGKAVDDSATRAHASGGASGRAKAFTLTVTPGDVIPVIVGAGGAAVSVNTNTSLSGNAGATTSCNAISVAGGSAGRAYAGDNNQPVAGADGGQGSNSRHSGVAPAMGMNTVGSFYTGTWNYYSGGVTVSCEAVNPFDNKRYLGAGGYAYANANLSSKYMDNETVPTLDDGYGAGAGASYAGATDATNVTAGRATGNGNGGGGAAISIYGSAGSGAATSGAGSDGAVFIYARGVS